MKKSIAFLSLLGVILSLTLTLPSCYYNNSVSIDTCLPENYTVKITKEGATTAAGIGVSEFIAYEARVTKDNISMLITKLNGKDTEILQTSEAEDIGIRVIYGNTVTQEYSGVLLQLFDIEKESFRETSDDFFSIFDAENGNEICLNVNLTLNEDGLPETLSYIRYKSSLYGVVDLNKYVSVTCEFSDYEETELHSNSVPEMMSATELKQAVGAEKYPNYTAAVECTRSYIADDEENAEIITTSSSYTVRVTEDKLQLIDDLGNQVFEGEAYTEKKRLYETRFFPMREDTDDTGTINILVTSAQSEVVYDNKDNSYKWLDTVLKNGVIFSELEVTFNAEGVLSSLVGYVTTTEHAGSVTTITQEYMTVRFSEISSTTIS